MTFHLDLTGGLGTKKYCSNCGEQILRNDEDARCFRGNGTEHYRCGRCIKGKTT